MLPEPSFSIIEFERCNVKINRVKQITLQVKWENQNKDPKLEVSQLSELSPVVSNRHWETMASAMSVSPIIQLLLCSANLALQNQSAREKMGLHSCLGLHLITGVNSLGNKEISSIVYF